MHTYIHHIMICIYIYTHTYVCICIDINSCAHQEARGYEASARKKYVFRITYPALASPSVALEKFGLNWTSVRRSLC